jgi:hypothetical protein
MKVEKHELGELIEKIMNETSIIDVHTHIFDKSFGKLLLWGIDELLVYHYLVAEAMRYTDMSYEDFWKMPKRDQADFIWKTLFIERSPISEAARGVLTVLKELDLDVYSRDINSYRAFFEEKNVSEYINIVFKKANVKYAVMTNDPFVEEERKVWESGHEKDERFKSALRIDPLLVKWPTAYLKLKEWGYNVTEKLTEGTLEEIKRFLNDWIDKMDPVYMAASLPPTLRIPSDTETSLIIEKAIIEVSRERNIPFAMMIGVKKLTNPQLLLAGDSVGKANIESLEYLAKTYPHNKFIVTMLSRENQHELVVVARKFRNLHIFGCWWFLNNPSIIEELTRERIEMLGWSFTVQHSDARVLDQVIYKWKHSKEIIKNVLIEKYSQILDDGWNISEEEMRRDIKTLFGGEFEEFLKRDF